MNPIEYHPLPQPDEISRKERDDAMGGYLMMFAALGAGLPLPVINLIASIIYYFTNRKVSRFVRFHTLQALMSQIPLTIANSACLFWGIKIIANHDPLWSLNIYFFGYMFMVIAANLTYLIVGIVAAVKAYRGRMFYYWGFGPAAYHQVFKVTAAEAVHSEIPVNTPPKF